MSVLHPALPLGKCMLMSERGSLSSSVAQYCHQFWTRFPWLQKISVVFEHQTSQCGWSDDGSAVNTMPCCHLSFDCSSVDTRGSAVQKEVWNTPKASRLANLASRGIHLRASNASVKMHLYLLSLKMTLLRSEISAPLWLCTCKIISQLRGTFFTPITTPHVRAHPSCRACCRTCTGTTRPVESAQHAAGPQPKFRIIQFWCSPPDLLLQEYGLQMVVFIPPAWNFPPTLAQHTATCNYVVESESGPRMLTNMLEDESQACSKLASG